MNYVGEQLTFVVAQQPFQTPSASGAVTHTFCTLIPILGEDSTPLDGVHFPNNGLVWWMIGRGDLALAEPGRLVTATLEDAHRFDPAASSSQAFQAARDTVAASTTWLDVVRDLKPSVGQPSDLINISRCCRLDHPPTGQVYVRLGLEIVGPFQPRGVEVINGAYEFSLTPLDASQRIDKLSATLVSDLGQGLHEVVVTVSESDRGRDAGAPTRELRFELISPSSLDELRMKESIPSIQLQSERDRINAIAKRFLTRKQRQKLMGVLDEVIEWIGEPDESEAIVAVDLIERLRKRVEGRDKEERDLAQAILTGGFLDSALDDVKRAHLDAYVESRAGELSVKIQERIAGLEHEAQTLRGELRNLDEERERRMRELAADLEAERASTLSELAADRESLEAERAELIGRQEFLRGELAKLVERFESNRDQVKSEVLGLLPMLGILGYPQERGGAEADVPNLSDPQFVLPPFSRPGKEDVQVTEEEFFALFEEHVASRGFNYRTQDLQAFHVSMKCDDITVLGGPSGTGKSSLPLLYAEVLQGSGMHRFHHVSVRPSWLDTRDLLGHTNGLERRFEPTETGLFQQLIVAQEEHQALAGDAGMYLVCLDEMNLSQVEHYFSAFLDALQRGIGRRTVRCFSPESVRADATFSRWPSLELPPSLRFVGTVNFDETTRPFSYRVLDRVNLIEIAPSRLDLLASPESEHASEFTHSSVSLSHFRAWTSSRGALPADLARLIDELQPHLETLRCPITPRRYKAICRYVLNAGPVISSSSHAFDAQLKMRVIPQLRDLFRERDRIAVESMLRVLENDEKDFPQTIRALEQLRTDDFTVFGG